MSPFFTSIPVNLEETKLLLPRNSHVSGVTWNAQSQRLEIEWSNQELSHRYTFPVEFTVEALQEKKLPTGVKRRGEVEPTKENVELINTALTIAEIAQKKEPLRCASCGRKIHWDGLSQYVHSDGKTYRHPVRPKQKVLTPTDTLTENTKQ